MQASKIEITAYGSTDVLKQTTFELPSLLAPYEISGIVRAVGNDVTRIKVGDQV